MTDKSSGVIKCDSCGNDQFYTITHYVNTGASPYTYKSFHCIECGARNPTTQKEDRSIGCGAVSIDLPPPAGRYVVNEGLDFTFYKKPCGWHRFWTKVLLGWEWKKNDR